MYKIIPYFVQPTTFSLQVELGSNQPPFVSGSSKKVEQNPTGGHG